MPESLVYVVDDDDAVRRSLSLLLRSAGYAVSAHASAEALLAALDESGAPATACAVVDVRMAGMDGLALQQHLADRRAGRIPVVIVTGHADVPLAVRAMRNGAVDFIEKPYPPDRMLAAVVDAMARTPRESQAGDAMERLATLSPREREVLQALVAGQSNKEIARVLGLSPRTVEAHRAALMDRLGVKSLAQAIRLAIAAGVDRASFL